MLSIITGFEISIFIILCIILSKIDDLNDKINNKRK